MKKTISILLSVILLISSIPASVISVFADAIPEIVTVTDIAELQSAHNYNNNTNKTWVYTKEGAAELNVTFSADCSLENGVDYVYIYDGEDNQIKRYTGKQLASVEINVPGDTVKIKLVSDEDTNAYGFAVESVVGMTSISVETMPNTTKYLVNQEIDYTGLTVKGTFEDGTTKMIESGFQLSDVDIASVGTKTVTVTYNGVTTSFNVDIYEPVLKSLEIVTLPTVTDYYCGDTADLDLSGLELLATDEDGETFTVESGYQVSDFSTDSLGTQTITITYKNVSTSFDVKVLNSIKYSISGEFATVTGIANNSIKNLVIPATVEGKPITSVSSYAFQNITAIENVTLPNSITTIGYSAFNGCTSLKRINMPTSLESIQSQAFYNCSALEMVTFPNGLKTIGGEAFYNCNSFTGELVIPDSVTEIGDGAFRGANISSLVAPFVGRNMTTTTTTEYYEVLGYIFGYTSSSSPTYGFGVYQYWNNYYYYYFIPSTLTSVKITKQTEIPYGAFKNCTMLTSVEIPDDATSIGDEAYYGCTGLQSIELPETVTSIGSSAFNGCSNLININIPDGVTVINNCTFQNCAKLTKLNFPEDITTIGYSAFNGCTSLKRINMPTSLESIQGQAFYNCSALEMVTFPNGLKTIGREAFYNCNSFTGELVIPDSVTEIGDGAFRGANISSLVAPFVGKNMTTTTTTEYYEVLGYIFGYTSSSSSTDGFGVYQYYSGNYYYYYFIPSTLTSVKITKQTEIPYGAFMNCTMLTSVEIPDDVTSIGGSAYYGCTGLQSIELPETVTSIGSSAFNGCSNLAEINIPLSTTSIGYRAFYNCNSNKLKVYYFGSSSDYSNISIGSDNTPLNNARKYYNSCLPKNHRFDETYSTTNPTCIAQGYKTHKCTICGTDVKYDYVDANGHKYSSTVVAPTCTAQGYTKYTCSVCRDSYNSNYTNSLGHNYNTTITKQPTCTATGTKKYTCTRCSYNYTETIPANGHNYNTTVVEPTCTNDGYYVDVCSVCSHRTTRTGGPITVDKTAYPYPESSHNYSNNMSKEYSFCYPNASSLEITFSASTKTEANCDYIYIYDSQGNQIGKYSGTTLAGKTITISGDSFKIKLTSDSSTTYYGFSIESIVAVSNPMPALGHVYDDGVVITEPTCYSKGIKRFTCLVCGYINNEDIEPITLPDFQIDEVYTLSQIEKLKDIAKRGTIKDPSDNVAVRYDTNMGTQLNPLTNELYLGYKSSSDSLVFTYVILSEQYTETMTMEFKGYDKNAILTYHFEDKNGIINSKAQATITPQTYKEENTYTFTKIAGSSYSHLQESANECLDRAFDGWTIMLSSYCDIMTRLSSIGFTSCCDHSYTTEKSNVDGIEKEYCIFCHMYRYLNTGNEYHKFDDGIITSQPTCTKTGVKTYTCTNCGITKKSSVPAHNSVSMNNAVAPTCTTAGKESDTKCSTCGVKLTTGKTIPAKGHKCTTKVVKPTYAAKGYTLHTCSVCRKSYKDKYTNKLTVAKPTILKVTSPNSKQIKVTWDKKSYTGYQVQIATDSKFTKNKKSATIESAKAVTKTFAELKGKTKYYVRVRAYKTYNGKNYYSDWSTVKIVTTKK